MDKLYSLGFRLNRTSFTLAKTIGIHFEKNNVDLSVSQYVLLRVLCEEGNMTKRALAKFLSKEESTMEEVLIELEEKGFIEISHTSKDEYLLSIREKGTEQASLAIKCADDVFDNVVDSIDEQDLVLLAELLDEIYSNTSKLK